MAVVARSHKSGTVYWVCFRWHGKPVWERSGGDRRVAERLDAQRKREVKTGTYRPDQASSATTVRQWLTTHFAQRQNRNVVNDRAAIATHVVSREWLADLPIVEVRPSHLDRLVAELRATTSRSTGRTLSTKHVANIFGLVHQAFARAVRDELVGANPCVLERGTFRRRRVEREPYRPEEIVSLCSSEELSDVQKVFDTMAFFTGMREGEICGRRWRDWERATLPLGCLHVRSQYSGRQLKTEREAGEAPRQVPVHPLLARVLDAWWRVGWELSQCRAPTLDDYIVPNRDGGAHTKSSAYKAWVKACERAGVPNRSLHATRHSFITYCRRGGANPDVVESITHNAKGSVLDTYTHWQWEPRCEAVMCLGKALGGIVDSAVDSSRFLPSETSGGAGNRTPENTGHVAALASIPAPGLHKSAVDESAEEPPPRADVAAAQRCVDCGGSGEKRVIEGDVVALLDCPSCGGRS